jgi:multidrug transporter EmrE-like cation transporter
MLNTLLIAIYALTTSAGLVSIKIGTAGEGLARITDGKFQLHVTAMSILGIFLYGVSFLLYTYLISKFDLGYIIPVTTGIVYILIFIASFWIFKEQFTLVKCIGIALVLVGVALLNLKK